MSCALNMPEQLTFVPQKLTTALLLSAKSLGLLGRQRKRRSRRVLGRHLSLRTLAPALLRRGFASALTFAGASTASQRGPAAPGRMGMGWWR